VIIVAKLLTGGLSVVITSAVFAARVKNGTNQDLCRTPTGSSINTRFSDKTALLKSSIIFTLTLYITGDRAKLDAPCVKLSLAHPMVKIPFSLPSWQSSTIPKIVNNHSKQ
jgi:hypothetical protein